MNSYAVMSAVRKQQKADLAQLYRYRVETSRDGGGVTYYTNTYVVKDSGCVMISEAVRVWYQDSGPDGPLPYGMARVAQVVLRGKCIEVYECGESK